MQPATPTALPETPPAASQEATSDRPWAAGVDLVLGWGGVPFARQNLPTTGTQAITYSRSDPTQSDVQSFVLGGAFAATEKIELGLRVPFAFATFSPVGSETRQATSFGNMEVEGKYVSSRGARFETWAALGATIPTAQGSEIPTTLQNVSAQLVDPSSYDRFSLSRAAASARGYEDNQLFDPRRAGVIPAIGMALRSPSWSFEPSIKVENLFATSPAQAPIVTEAVGLVRAAYHSGPFEVAVRGWVTAGLAGADTDRTTTVAVEPDFALRQGAWRAYCGAIVPLAGPPRDAGFFALRIGASAAF